MDKDFQVIKTVCHSNYEAIKNIMDLYKIEKFNLDCTYSTGTFWKNLPQPEIRSDLYPSNEHVLEYNSESLPFEDNSIKSTMYDPPFVVVGKTYKTNKKGSSVIAKRFEGYENFTLLKQNYFNTLKELYRVTEKNGLVVMKCQDTVSGGKNHFSHVMVMNMAQHIGFYPKDLFVLISKGRINSFGGRWNQQIHARKHHAYFFVFEKTKPKVNYDFL